MLVSHLKKFIYTKTSKTASTSVESYFEKYCMPDGEWEFKGARSAYMSEVGIIGYRGNDSSGEQWYNHMAASNIKSQIGETKWDEYFKFAIIRDPFDKLVSQFFFVGNSKGTEKQVIENFKEWVRSGGEIIDRSTYIIQGQVCLDYFIRYEDLKIGIKQVCMRLGIPFEPERLPRLKANYRNREIPLELFYDEATTRIVQKKYAFELAYFGYSPPLI